MAKKNFYITTTAPYVNAKPHLGFALEIIQADLMARYHRLLEDNVLFGFGTDEHGQKIYQKSILEKNTPQAYVNEYAARFDALKKALNLSYNSFVRTTDTYHQQAAQEFWKRCAKHGYIYKAKYKVKYCVGCEMEKTDSELIQGKCPFHPNIKLEIREEPNYFFRFSKLGKRLLDFYQKNPEFVKPESRYKEIKNFVKTGLQDFSISRLKEKMPWGIPVPNDTKQVMYVWFDALVFYISALGWPKNNKKFNCWWPGIQVAGKDNLRQQSAMWQAMLIAAGLPNSKQILIHGFITSSGQKMSKSLGNVVDPFYLVKKYGTDALRYYLLKEIPPFNDADFTIAHFEKVYNADLANGLGNLVQRVLSLIKNNFRSRIPNIEKISKNSPLILNEITCWKKYHQALEKYKFNEALAVVWQLISITDRYIDNKKPWEMIKSNNKKKLAIIIFELLEILHQIAWMIAPFMPETSREISRRLNVKTLQKSNPQYKDSWLGIKGRVLITLGSPLFPRLK